MDLRLCRDITESEVQQGVRSGVTTASLLVDIPGLDAELCCRRCVLQIEEFLSLAPEAHGTIPEVSAA